MADIAMMIGALLPTFLISRLFLFLMKTWNGGNKKLFIVHGMSLVVATLIGGMGMADGGAFAPIKALSVYIIPQAIWLGVDIYRSKKQAKSIQPETSASNE